VRHRYSSAHRPNLNTLLLVPSKESTGGAAGLSRQTSSSSLNMFDNLPGPSSIADSETLVSGVKAIGGKYQALYPALFPRYRALQRCFEKLQEIRGLLDGLSEHRRRKIQIASQRGACFSLEDLELELNRLVYDYRDLCRLYKQSSAFQRYFPSSKGLQAHLSTFEDRLQECYTDAWKTTAPGDRSINWSMFRTNMS